MTDYSGKVIAEKYRIDSLIGKSGLGDLYRGTHLAMEKPVTIKILPPELAVDQNIAGQFADEAKTLSRLQHPNVLNITDSGADITGAKYIVFENADGDTLKTVIAREGQLPLVRANRIVRQVAAALAVAHSASLVHGKLNDEIVLLNETAAESDAVKLMFDSSANESDGIEEVSASEARFLSPEQCAQTSEPDARSDVYSLGVILYEMLAGETPFTAATANDVMLKQAQEPPLPLSAFRADLSREADTVVMTALAKNPEMRYQNANDFAAALNRVTLDSTIAEDGTPRFSTPAPVAAVQEEPQNNLWKTAFILLAGVAVLGAFFIYITQVKQTNPQTSLATDANGIPVQPVNPATGTSEQSLANMGGFSPQTFGNSNAMTNGAMMPQVMPGGDGYDPWARGVTPPPGSMQGNYSVPTYVAPPTGQYYDGSINSTSPFMQDGNTYILVPKNANTNVNTATKKNPAANTNTQTPANTATKPAPTTPAANTTTAPDAKQTPAKPATKATPKPNASPKANTTQKESQSGKEVDTL